MKINDEIRRRQMLDKLITIFIQVMFVVFLIAFVIMVISSCVSDTKDEPCNLDCGKLITKYHYRELQAIDYTYVTNCNDTLTSTVFLNEEQLGVDNGVAYFINTYSLKDYYCE